MRFKRTVVAAAAVGLLIGVPTAGAAGKALITGNDVKNGTIMARDLSEGVQRKLDTRVTNVSGATAGGQGVKGDTGAVGPKGDKGDTVVGPEGPKGDKGDTVVGPEGPKR